ncbi:PREDICTED: heme-binding protein 1-like [Nanorana parkeri]|uniref:heme-binding protein 1-like n=1 Tax=Nanorana parkeri TaxID=125878 RepID=UPI00085458F1|nr:PREDICTED: heme-binding protein 1-like [Nanorana parkeri]
MACFCLLVLSLFSLCGAEVKAEENAVEGLPPFCGSYECPRYQVLKKYNTFEVRRYDSTFWVTTYLNSGSMGLGTMKSFRRLFKYISGENSQGISIKMNVPVRITVPLLDTNVNSTMSLFLPSALMSPPTPNDPSIVLESFPPTSYYVRSFGGYAMTSDYEKNSKALSEELTALGLAYDTQTGMAAAYNDPLTFFGRHNEVWFRSLN